MDEVIMPSPKLGIFFIEGAVSIAGAAAGIDAVRAPQASSASVTPCPAAVPYSPH